MDQEEVQLRLERHRRIRWMKRLLRPLPRRANIHRYPFLRRFSGFARRRAYLWSFRVSAMTPAFYGGAILSLLPLYGVQIPLAFLLSLVLRANLPVVFGLQFITNPFTIAPIYFVSFQIGRLFLSLFGVQISPLTVSELAALLNNLFSGYWAQGIEYLLQVFAITSLGGLIVGTFVGAMLSMAYRIMVRRGEATFARLRELQLARERQNRTVEATDNPRPRIFRKRRKRRRR